MTSSENTRSTPKNVAVLVDTSTSWGRSVIEGIHSYQNRNQRWHLYVEPRGLDQKLSLPTRWNGQGVIARVGYHELSKQLKKCQLPVVNVSGIRVPGANFPRITIDLRKSAVLAAEHFMDHGLRHLAYFSLIRIDYVSQHQLAFSNHVKKRGGSCNVFESEENKGSESEWVLDVSKVSEWLASLPKPVGILTWSAGAARELTYACLESGYKIPEEIAILSGSDDELFCKMAPIPISAVRCAAEEIGFLAAQCLDKMMSALHDGNQSEVLVQPVGIITRQSTEMLAVEDAALAKALRYIREDPSRNMNVNDVAAHAGFCRRVLEQRFAKILGRSPAAEIKRVRVECALHYLQTTNLRIADVAEKSGFSSAEYMATVFRNELGAAPLSFRRKNSMI